MAIGTLTQKVNAAKYQLWIRNSADSAEDEWVLLQNKRMLISAAELREPTTSGGNAYYTGQPDNILTGTLLFTRDLWNDATYGLAVLLTRTNGERPERKIKAKLVDASGTTITFTFTAKLSVGDINGGPEGGTKVDVTFILTGDPTVA